MSTSDEKRQWRNTIHTCTDQELEAMLGYESYEGLTTRSLCPICRTMGSRRYACSECLRTEQERRKIR